jgi:uncharacterized protein (DUF111 family)
VKLTIQVSFKTPAAELVTETVETSIATVAAWERKFKRRISDLQAGIGVDDLMFMSWHRLTADKKESRDYDTWLNSVENFDVLETSAANPTEATA